MINSEKQTRLYGLAEGLIGKHILAMDVQQALGMLPKKVQYACLIKDSSIRAYSPCDG